MYNGYRNRAAIPMRNAATSSLPNASKPRFIKIKELPQVNERAIKIIQDLADIFTRQS